MGEWETVRLRGSWRVGRTAGGSRNFASYPTNPRFPLSVPEGAGPRCVRITLRQHCRDHEGLAIGFHIFQAGAPAPGRPGGVSRVGQRGPRGLSASSSHTQDSFLFLKSIAHWGSRLSSGSPSSTRPGSEPLDTCVLSCPQHCTCSREARQGAEGAVVQQEPP